VSAAAANPGEERCRAKRRATIRRRRRRPVPRPKRAKGVTGQKVRYVLYWALGGVIVIYAVIYFFFLR
jgi:hypothetical protein